MKSDIPFSFLFRELDNGKNYRNPTTKMFNNCVYLVHFEQIMSTVYNKIWQTEKNFLIKVRSNFLKLILYFLVLRISFIFQLETWRIDTNCIGYFAWSFRLFQTIRSGETRILSYPSQPSVLSPGKQWMIEYCHHFKGCLLLHLINLQTDRSKSTYENWIFPNVKSFQKCNHQNIFLRF